MLIYQMVCSLSWSIAFCGQYLFAIGEAGEGCRIFPILKVFLGRCSLVVAMSCFSANAPTPMRCSGCNISIVFARCFLQAMSTGVDSDFGSLSGVIFLPVSAIQTSGQKLETKWSAKKSSAFG